jgi:hypothetical protein
MRIGDMVRMTGGPFVGMHGTVVRPVGRRVILALVLGNRQVQIGVEREWTIAATARRRPASRSENPKPSQRRAG